MSLPQPLAPPASRPSRLPTLSGFPHRRWSERGDVMRGRRRSRGARSARERETCRGRTAPRRCPPAERERVLRCPRIFSRSLFFQTSQRKQNTKVTVTGVACSRRTRAPRLLAAHSRPPRDAPAWPRARRTPRLQSLGSTERRRARPACVRVGCEGGGKLSWARAQRPRLPGRSSCRSVECRWVRTGTPSPLAPGHRAPPAVTRSSRP